MAMGMFLHQKLDQGNINAQYNWMPAKATDGQLTVSGLPKTSRQRLGPAFHVPICLVKKGNPDAKKFLKLKSPIEIVQELRRGITEKQYEYYLKQWEHVYITKKRRR